MKIHFHAESCLRCHWSHTWPYTHNGGDDTSTLAANFDTIQAFIIRCATIMQTHEDVKRITSQCA